jgi:arylsulfatase
MARYQGHSRQPGIDAARQHYLGFEFNTHQSLKMRPVKNDFHIDNGILSYAHDPSNFLHNVQPLDMKKDKLGDIEIRMKVNHAKKVILGLSRFPEAKPNDPAQTIYLAFWTIPDSDFHTYRMDAQTFLKGSMPGGESIRSVFLFPFEIEKDKVEIDFIRFISRKAKYGQKTHGLSYEVIDREMRKTLYMRTGGRLSYVLTIPEGRPLLSFGMGVLDGNEPVAFNIAIRDDTGTKTIYAKQISSDDAWHDAEIDLAAHAGARAELLFSVQGEINQIAFWSNPVLYTLPKERFNVIFVLEDALRADRMSIYDDARKTTPVKDEFAQKGVVFLNAFSQATHTRASCASFMTSLYPSATGVWNASEVLDERYLTLPEIMRHQGFATASFIQNVNAGPHVGLHQGFGTLFDLETLAGRADALYRNDDLYQWLEKLAGRNFFLYIHILDPHGPYDPPEAVMGGYRKGETIGRMRVEKNAQLDPDWLDNPTFESRNFLYDLEIKYNDSCFKDFLSHLKKMDLLKNTLIVFLSDHGEHMGEHLIWDHVAPGYRQVLHVPLIMVYPGILPSGLKLRQTVQLVDIMPTVLSLAGVPKKNLLMSGDSLIPLIQGKNLNFWNNRVSISEEIKFMQKGDPRAFGSLFYRNRHILTSAKLNDTFSHRVKGFSSNLYGTFFMDTRVFDLEEDRNEFYDAVNFILDPLFNYRIQRFLKNFKRENLLVWKTISGELEHTIRYDPKTLEQLRSLGYVK